MKMCEKIIYKQNLLDNIKIIKDKIKDKKLCAVVKADAYGFGVNNIVPIIKNKIDFFAVATLSEAIKVRHLTSKPILILGEIDNSDIKNAIINNISISVGNSFKLKTIAKIAKSINLVARIHFKINTGMNRLGFDDIKKFKKCFDEFKCNKFLRYEGIYSHIYNYEDFEKTMLQKQKFKMFLNKVDNQNLIKHLASTNVVLNYNNLNYDMCRIGIGMYNYADFNLFGLKSIGCVKSKIINVINVKKNNSVGYGCNFVCKKATKVAVVSIGYADGYLRIFGNQSYVIINNKMCKVIGSICMDMCFVDCSDVNVKIGDDVLICGSDGKDNINANYLADIAKTIDYEILTNFKNERMNVKVI